MEERGISAYSLANLLKERGGSTPGRTTLRDYVTGRFSPTAETLLDIAAVLRVSGAWLLTGEGDRKPQWDPFTDLRKQEWIPATVRERLVEGSTLAAQARASVERRAGNEKNPGDAIGAANRGALGFQVWLEQCVAEALRLAGGGEGTHEAVAALFVSRGKSREFGDALLLLALAHDRLIESLDSGVLAIGERSAAPRPAALRSADSVASSVGNAHNSTEKKRKRPKSKKGQPRG